MNSQDTKPISTVGRIHTSDLDHFVSEIDELGGINSPQTAQYISNFSLIFDTQVDETINPFSEEYFKQQIKVYEEISGRSLDQQEGEQFKFDVETHVQSVNPHNTQDISFMSKHVRTISTALYMANLPPGSRVLDMGSGWGLSSEIFAFCAADVTCVDINPLFIDLNKKRATRLNLPMDAQCSEFDNYQDDRLYDLVFFYECLHHALKPWETLENIVRFLKTDGKVVFAAEPINDTYWQTWGLRLDPSSVYCIRKYGWFESGWSEACITQIFEHVGLNLNMYHHVGIENGIIGLATKISNPLKPEEAFNLSPTNLGQTYDALGQQHFTLAKKYHTLAEKHHALAAEYNSLVNSRLVRLKRKIWNLFNLSMH